MTDYNTKLTAIIAVDEDDDLKTVKDDLVQILADNGYDPHAISISRNTSDPIDVHRALQKAARELAHYADYGSADDYLDAINNLETKLQDVRNLPTEVGPDDELSQCGG
jgi:hypothetical protein